MACRRSAVRSRLAPPLFAHRAKSVADSLQKISRPLGRLFCFASCLRHCMMPAKLGEPKMQRKIALEENFAIEPTLGDSKVFGAHVWPERRHRLIDIQETRLGEMD